MTGQRLYSRAARAGEPAGHERPGRADVRLALRANGYVSSAKLDAASWKYNSNRGTMGHACLYGGGRAPAPLSVPPRHAHCARTGTRLRSRVRPRIRPQNRCRGLCGVIRLRACWDGEACFPHGECRVRDVRPIKHDTRSRPREELIAMRKQDFDRLDYDFAAELSADQRDVEFRKALGAWMPNARALFQEIAGDLDEKRFGIGWWAPHPDKLRRILISDQLLLMRAERQPEHGGSQASSARAARSARQVSYGNGSPHGLVSWTSAAASIGQSCGWYSGSRRGRPSRRTAASDGICSGLPRWRGNRSRRCTAADTVGRFWERHEEVPLEGDGGRLHEAYTC